MQDRVWITIDHYIPRKACIYIYDMMGRLGVKQWLYFGRNSLDLLFLSSGIFIYTVRDGSDVLKKDKSVKVE